MQQFKNMTKEEFKKLNSSGIHFWENGYNVVITCKYIQTWEQFTEVLGNAFQLPMRNENYHGTADWMQDLTWLGKHEIIRLYFYEWNELAKLNEDVKKHIVMLLSSLTQWWKEDVKDSFMDGKPGEPKEFEVVLVN